MKVKVRRTHDNRVGLDAYIGNRRYAYVDARIESSGWRLDEPYLLVVYIYVAPSLRRKGVATSLVSLLKKLTGISNVLMTSMSDEGGLFAEAIDLEEE